MRFAKIAIGLVTAGAAVFSATPAMAARDVCAGVVEADGCDFCSYQGTPVGQPTTNCDFGYTGYTWQRCAVWVDPVCVVGNII